MSCDLAIKNAKRLAHTMLLHGARRFDLSQTVAQRWCRGLACQPLRAKRCPAQRRMRHRRWRS